MAYKQSGLKNIGDVRDKIAKRKLEKRFGSVQGAKEFAAEQFRSRAEERKLSKKTVVPTETSFTTSIKPFEKETIKFDIPEKVKSTKKSKIPKSKIKTKKGSGGVIREKSGTGKQALIGLGTLASIFLGASKIFGTQRGYGAENAKNIGGN